MEALRKSVEVVCEEWSPEDLILVLNTLKSVRTGKIELSLRENRVVGVVRRPFNGFLRPV